MLTPLDTALAFSFIWLVEISDHLLVLFDYLLQREFLNAHRPSYQWQVHV